VETDDSRTAGVAARDLYRRDACLISSFAARQVIELPTSLHSRPALPHDVWRKLPKLRQGTTAQVETTVLILVQELHIEA
jgi:hypothetical protein